MLKTLPYHYLVAMHVCMHGAAGTAYIHTADHNSPSLCYLALPCSHLYIILPAYTAFPYTYIRSCPSTMIAEWG
jgi:hypothetical protein